MVRGVLQIQQHKSEIFSPWMVHVAPPTFYTSPANVDNMTQENTSRIVLYVMTAYPLRDRLWTTLPGWTKFVQSSDT